MEKRFPFLIGLIIILVMIGSQSIFIVNQTEKALVIQLGDPVDKVFGPAKKASPIPITHCVKPTKYKEESISNCEDSRIPAPEKARPMAETGSGPMRSLSLPAREESSDCATL